MAGTSSVLLRGLWQLYIEMLQTNGIRESQLDAIFASGMVTSPFGIKEIPHLSTPVSASDLYEGLYAHYEPIYFKQQIKLIRGVKTVGENVTLDINSVCEVNNMRGEEIEIFGIMDTLTSLQQKDIAIILPGSHTHVAYIKNECLFDIWSTFSGELFDAVSKHTILSSSVSTQDESIDEELALLGFENLRSFGINRALYICHAMKIFAVADNLSRKSYLEGIIAGDIVNGLKSLLDNKWSGVQAVVIAGDSRLTHIYEILLKKVLPSLDTISLAQTKACSFAVKGLLKILSSK